MYDTIKMSLRNEPVLQSAVMPKIEKMKEVWNGDLAGKIGTMDVIISSSYISINGSLSKYYSGGEQIYLNIDQTEKAINRLSNESGLDLNYANIRRLDVTANLNVTYTPQTYYQTLVSLPKYERDIRSSSTGETLYFNPIGRRKSRTISLYRKSGDLLRYELQIKRPNVVLGLDVMGHHLYNTIFRNQCADAWKHHAMRIHMQNPYIGRAIPLGRYDSLKEIREYLVNLALAQNPHVWVTILENCKDRKLRYSANQIRTRGLKPIVVEKEIDLVREFKEQIEIQYTRMIEDVSI